MAPTYIIAQFGEMELPSSAVLNKANEGGLARAKGFPKAAIILPSRNPEE